MTQKLIIKVVFDSTREGLESFGNNRYLLKLSYPEDAGAKKVIIAYISRHLGIPESKVAFIEQDIRKNWIFEVL